MTAPWLTQALNSAVVRAQGADLGELLTIFADLVRTVESQGVDLSRQVAYHPLAFKTIALQEERISSSQLGIFLAAKLRQQLAALAASPGEVAAMLAGASFVLDTVIDMLEDEDQPFEVTAMVYENQPMFDSWYDQLLAMTGLHRN